MCLKNRDHGLYLAIEDIGLRVGFNEVVSAPLDGLQGVTQLSLRLQLRPVLNHTPGQHCHGVCEW